MRFLLVLRGIPFSFYSLFSKRDEKLIVFTSFHNKKFDSNSKYLFLYFLKEHPEYTCKFVVNDNELREKLEKEIGPYFVNTNTVEGIKTVLKAKTWFASALELPILGFALRVRRTVVHLGHGAPLKNVGLMENDVSFVKRVYYWIVRSNISYSLATSETMTRVIKTFTGLSEKHVIIAGEPRNDAFDGYTVTPEILNNDGVKVLYAPTWRHYEDTKLFPFADFDVSDFDNFLKENNITIYLRVHPNFDNHKADGMFNSERIKLFTGVNYPEIMDYMQNFDSIITDYSSIYFNFLILDRPIIFLPYDIEEYLDKVGLALDYDEFTPGDKAVTYEEFKKSLLQVKNNPEMYSAERNVTCDKINVIREKNCDYMFNLLKDKGCL